MSNINEHFGSPSGSSPKEHYDHVVSQNGKRSESNVSRRMPRRSSLPIMSSNVNYSKNMIMPSNVEPADVNLLSAMVGSHQSSRETFLPREVFVPQNPTLHTGRRSSYSSPIQHEIKEKFNSTVSSFQSFRCKMQRRLSFENTISSYKNKQSELVGDSEKYSEVALESPNGSFDKKSSDNDMDCSDAKHEGYLIKIKEDFPTATDKISKVITPCSSTDGNSSESSHDWERAREDSDTFDDDIDDSKWYPNSPHPSLEYPALYFILKCLPIGVMSWIRNIYKFRWELSYPLQKRVPLSKKLWRKVGISLTWGELLLWTPLFIILIQGIVSSFVNPSVTKSGIVARLPLAICYLTANRNSLLTLLLGIPFERALKYHKVSGYCAFIIGMFHTYVAFAVEMKDDETENDLVHFSVDGQVNTSGTLLLMVISAMIITSLPVVRRKVFELFYYLHIMFAIAMSVCAFYHSGIFVVVFVSILWGGDLIMRKIIMMWRYPRKATVKRLTDSIIEISFPKTKHLDYNCGQYMFIAVPELSIFQWHPISISSSPYQQNVTFHVRKRGYWTSALYNLAGKKKEITILLEGPYGSSSVDLISNRYKMAMFLSGGIGVTPMQSICHQMLYEHEWGERKLKKLWFIWTARDPTVMENMDVVSNRSDKFVLENTPIDELTASDNGGSPTKNSVSISDASVMTARMLTDMPVSHTPDDELESEFPIDDFVEDEDDDKDDEGDGEYKKEELNLPIGDSFHGDIFENDEENQYQGSVMNDDSVANEEVLSLDCYLTAKEIQDAGIVSMPFVQQGRPDMKKIFLNMREEAIKAGEKRVAVCVCAPKRLVQICKMACTKYSNRKVRFDFHSEVFD